jgi:prophage DNA circulation protein
LRNDATGAAAYVEPVVTAPVVQAFEMQSLKIAALEKSVAVLQQAYDAQSGAYVELRSKLENSVAALEKTISNVAGTTPSQDEVDELADKLARHKHAVGSGEAMQPMEVAA